MTQFLFGYTSNLTHTTRKLNMQLLCSMYSIVRVIKSESTTNMNSVAKNSLLAGNKFEILIFVHILHMISIQIWNSNKLMTFIFSFCLNIRDWVSCYENKIKFIASVDEILKRDEVLSQMSKIVNIVISHRYLLVIFNCVVFIKYCNWL